MKKGILELIKKIYGSNALSKVLGTRTNVIRLPDNELKQYTNKELNIEAASDKLVQKAKTDINELLAEYPRMNDAEKLIFEGNLTRLGNKLGVTEKGPAADVIKFGTGEKVSPEGVMSLTEKIGQKNAPGTLVGNLESRIKQLEASGEELSKLKGKTYDEFMKDITQGQKAMRKLEDEGLVRAAAREIINKDIKSGKIKLPKEIEQDMVQGGGEPINVLRQFYGEGALEQLDSMIPEFKKMYSPKEAADAATKKFKFEFKADRPPGSTSIEDAKKTQVTDLKTEATKRKSVDDLIDEYNANQDRLRLSDKEGGTLIGYEEYEQLRKRNKDIAKTLEDKGISSKVEKKPEAEIIPFTNKPDPEDFATGGRVGMAGGGILKLAMKFFNDNNPVSAYKKYLKYVKETAQKDPAKLAPEVGGIVVGSELIHRGLRRKLKEVKEKNNENDSENLETDNRTEKAGGGVSQGLDYLAGIERRGYAGGSILKTIGKKIIKKSKKLKKPTKDDYDEYREILDHPEYEVVQGNETFEQLDELVKKQKDYESYMYAQYKMGKLDPVAGEQSPARMKILQRKLEEAGATKDKRLIDADELQELDKLEKIYLKPDKRSLTPSSPLINISDPEVASDFANFAKQNDPEGYKKIEDIANKINQKIELENFDITGRKKNAGGGRMGFKKGSFLINTAIDAAKNLSKKKSKKELKRQLTDNEIDDLAADVGDLDAYLDFDGTVGSAEKIRKQHKEYMDYMYYQYKTGRLDPKPGEMNTSRMQYLRNKRKQAEMTDDPKLFNPNERDELDNLEEIFSESGIKKYKKGDPITSENFGDTGFAPDTTGLQKAREIEDINQKKILENFDITGRKKNAKGGLNYLMGL
jgi:hypothetical protein